MNLFFERIKFNKILNFFQIRLEYPTKQNLVCFRGGLVQKKLLVANSVTRLGYFWTTLVTNFGLKKVLVINFGFKNIPSFNTILKPSFLSKNFCNYFGATFDKDQRMSYFSL